MNKISLYLHFPFCKNKCGYCDFYSLPALSRIPAYESALCRAIPPFREALSSYTVDTLYWGGGTPSLISPEGVQAVFSALRENFSLSGECEITMEMNPESASDEILLAAQIAGVNRLSFGMQSAVDEELSAIGRCHRAKDVRSAVKRAKQIGFDNISLDLMYGLPGQTRESFRQSLEAALSMDIQHISYYCLTLSSTVPLCKIRESLPGEEEVREMYLDACSFVKRSGLDQYEISNAARPGFASRHNLCYWEGGEYLGFGPGAHSYFQGKRFFVKEDLESFLSDPEGSVQVEETLSFRDRLEENVMLSLRLAKGLDLHQLEAFCRKETVQRIEEKFSLWARHGLAEKTRNGFRLTPEGFFVSNEMIASILSIL